MFVVVLLGTLLVVWLVYKFTIYALPCLTGLAVARFAQDTGAGGLGAFVIWVASSLFTLAVIQCLYTTSTHPVMRLVISAAFVTPGVLMSYFLLDDISAGQIPSELWRQAICVFGASVAGMVSFARLSEA